MAGVHLVLSLGVLVFMAAYLTINAVKGKSAYVVRPLVIAPRPLVHSIQIVTRVCCAVLGQQIQVAVVTPTLVRRHKMNAAAIVTAKLGFCAAMTGPNIIVLQ